MRRYTMDEGITVLNQARTANRLIGDTTNLQEQIVERLTLNIHIYLQEDPKVLEDWPIASANDVVDYFYKHFVEEE